jgi:hypothetical protein
MRCRGASVSSATRWCPCSPKDLPFTAFRAVAGRVPPRPRVCGGGPIDTSAAAAAEGDDDDTYAVLSRVLGFSAVPRRLLAADNRPG